MGQDSHRSVHCHRLAQLREIEPGKNPQRSITNTQANDGEHGLDAKPNTAIPGLGAH